MEGALFVTLATVQLSLVTGVPRLTFVAVHPAFADTVTSDGQTIVGFIVSRTITRCVQLFVLPLPSTAVHVTMLVPKTKTDGALFVTAAMLKLSEATASPKDTLVATHAALAETI